jgi:hypothetical protein
MARSNCIFTRQTGFVTLDRLPKRLHADKTGAISTKGVAQDRR